MDDQLRAYLGPDEKIELDTRQHVFVIVDDMIKALALLIVLGAIIWGITKAGFLDNSVGDWITYLVFAGIAIVVLRLVWTVIGWRHERLLVTSSKVVHISGVLNREVTGTPLVKIDEVVLTQPFFGRMVGYGRLDVENAAGGKEPLHGLKFIPRPAAVYQELTSRARSQRMLEGGAMAHQIPTGMDE